MAAPPHRAGRGKSRPTSVGDILQRGAVLGPARGVDSDQWRAAVGFRLSERTAPGRLANGTLTVHVRSSVWAQELSLLAPQILEHLRAVGVQAHKLHFVTASAETVAEAQAVAPARHVPRPASIDAALRTRLDAIEDADLRASVEAAAAYTLGAVAEHDRRRHAAQQLQQDQLSATPRRARGQPDAGRRSAPRGKVSSRQLSAGPGRPGKARG